MWSARASLTACVFVAEAIELPRPALLSGTVSNLRPPYRNGLALDLNITSNALSLAGARLALPVEAR
jgi:hypothetical protein